MPAPAGSAGGTVFDMQQFLNGSGSGAEEPIASLDKHGLSLRLVRCDVWFTASLNTEERIGPLALILSPMIGHPLRLL